MASAQFPQPTRPQVGTRKPEEFEFHPQPHRSAYRGNISIVQVGDTLMSNFDF